MTSRNKSGDSIKPKRPPARTPEGRENQMISLALDQAELQLREGVAPAPVVVHYLKLATETTMLERERLRAQIELDRKKAEILDKDDRIEELYEEAITAMREYQGQPPLEDYEEHDGFD